jgi:antitoxin component of RelBE/YafQ-DinJ toxin-antitoxin module
MKAAILQVRVQEAEKQAFHAAAELAGLDLSAWVRERLRLLARRELEKAGQPVPFLNPSRNPER